MDFSPKLVNVLRLAAAGDAHATLVGIEDVQATAEFYLLVPECRNELSAIQLLAYLAAYKPEEARMQWLAIAAADKEHSSSTSLKQVWEIVQRVLRGDVPSAFTLAETLYAGTQHIGAMSRAFVNAHRQHRAGALSLAYSNLLTSSAAVQLGLSEADSITYLIGLGWAHDAASHSLSFVASAVPKKVANHSASEKLAALSELTSYVRVLESDRLIPIPAVPAQQSAANVRMPAH